MSRVFTLAAALVVITPIAAQAATAKGHTSFSMPHRYEQSVNWYEAHRHGVFGASNCRILKARGDGQYLVQTNTPLGACRYILKETREQGKTKAGQRRTIYRITFVRSVSGRVTNQRLTIALTDKDGATEVGMWITTSFAGRFVPAAAVRSLQASSLDSCENYIRKNAR